MEGNGRIGRIIFKNISMPREMGIDGNMWKLAGNIWRTLRWTIFGKMSLFAITVEGGPRK
jgi:hypothetical protein